MRQHAFNVSLGALITLGGDFNSNSAWIRLLMGIEAVIGFGLLTTSVSWLLSIYPLLEQRRSLAQATLLHHARLETGIDPALLPGGEAQDVLDGLTAELVSLRNQMAQFPITHYFHMGESETALAGIIGYVAGLGARAASPNRPPAVQLAGTSLGGAVEDFLEFVAHSYLRMPTSNMEAIRSRRDLTLPTRVPATGSNQNHQREVVGIDVANLGRRRGPAGWATGGYGCSNGSTNVGFTKGEMLN